ncbi:MAG TPA: DUF6644 family protein [Novosphingobium sp.]|nr:DUF6644 family protein [Novosphingobium sp.]
METLTALSDTLAASGLSIWIASQVWTVPMLQSVHILAIGVILASLAMLDLRLAGLIGREQSLRELTLRFYPWIWGALAVLVTTGFLQIMAEPARELLNWVFWTKMGLIVAAVLFTAPLRSLIEDCRYRDLAPRKRTIFRTCALVSLVLWVLVVTCGRWIAYAGDLAA